MYSSAYAIYSKTLQNLTFDIIYGKTHVILKSRTKFRFSTNYDVKTAKPP